MRLYGWFEVAIPLYAVGLHFVLTSTVLEVGALVSGGSATVTASRFAVAFLLLVVPTSLMGGTLPILARYLRDSGTTASQSAGRL